MQLLAALEDNQKKASALLPSADLELKLFGWMLTQGTERALADLHAAETYTSELIPKLRGKQLTLKGRRFRGRDQLSESQVIFLNCVAPKWIVATRAVSLYANAVTAFLLNSATLSVSSSAKETSNSRSVDFLHSRAIHEVKALELTLALARAETFYPGGTFYESHRKFLSSNPSYRNMVRDEDKSDVDDENDPWGIFGGIDTETGVGKGQKPQENVLLGAAQDPKQNAALYGDKFHTFMEEHGRRLSHFYFFFRYTEASLSRPSQDHEEQAPSEDSDLDQQRGQFDYVHRVVISWGLHSCSIDHLSNIGSCKQTLAIVLASTLVFVPPLRELAPQSFWAPVAISLILTDPTHGLGASIAVGEVRLLGTTLGCMAALFIISVAAGPHLHPGNVAALSLLLGVWCTLSGLFRGHATKGYAAVVAAFTCAIIIHGGATLDPADGLTRADLVFHRIKMNVAGVAVFVLVDVILWPHFAQDMVKEAQPKVLKALARAVSAVFAPESRSMGASVEEEMDSDGEGNLRAALSEGREVLARAAKLLGPADGEPTLWRVGFARKAYAHALDAEATCFEMASELRAALKEATQGGEKIELGENHQGMPPSVARALKLFASALGDAIGKASEAWDVCPSDKVPTRDPALRKSDDPEAPVPPPTPLSPRQRTLCRPNAAFTSAVAVATPLISLHEQASANLIKQRDHLILLAFEKRFQEAMPQPIVLGWMGIVFLCSELSAALLEVGVALRDARAAEAPLD